jgi:hypothetical protein
MIVVVLVDVMEKNHIRSCLGFLNELDGGISDNRFRSIPAKLSPENGVGSRHILPAPMLVAHTSVKDGKVMP